jgi:hypothetical protein
MPLRTPPAPFPATSTKKSKAPLVRRGYRCCQSVRYPSSKSIIAKQRKSSAVRKTADSKPGTRDYDGSYHEHPEGSCLAYRKLSWS